MCCRHWHICIILYYVYIVLCMYYVCMHVCESMYVHVGELINRCVRACACACVCVCVSLRVCVFVPLCVCFLCMFVSVRVFVRERMRACAHMSFRPSSMDELQWGDDRFSADDALPLAPHPPSLLDVHSPTVIPTPS